MRYNAALKLRAAFPIVAAILVSCGPRADKTAILLFDGPGTSPNDVKAIAKILDENHLAYATVDSSYLSRIHAANHLLIVPGGNFEVMGKGLTPGAVAQVRDAIHGGLNYLGVCAGAFLAGNSPYNGLNLTQGVRFGFYAAESRGIRKAALTITTPSGSSLDHYWEDGPELSGWGAVAAKYPDGTPAVVQGTYGKGWIVLTGLHPEAPESWRRGLTFTTPVDASNAYFVTLVRAALDRTPLAHF